jgi:phage gp16-like protein
MSDARRTRELAKIHAVAWRQLGLDEETYRAMLHEVAGVTSAADLDAAGRARVLDHLARLGGRARHRYPGRPHNTENPETGPLLRKVEALLAEAGRPWSYADALAKRMYSVDRTAWCKADQLRGIIAALTRDAARHGRRTQ